MYKVLLVDDEPLARMGLSAMISGCSLDIEIQGSAANGKAALDIMEESLPDIVITDIRMPVMSGLELLEYSSTHFHPAPAFIILTSYEDFSYALEALRYSACGYLLKMDLSHEKLTEALERAIETVRSHRSNAAEPENPAVGNVFINRFYNNLLSGGYHSEEEILDIARNFNLHLEADRYLAVCAQVKYPDSVKNNYMQQYNLYLRVMEVLESTVNLYAPCFVISSRYERIIFVMMFERSEDIYHECECAVKKASSLCTQYFGVHIACGAGCISENLLGLPASLRGAQSAMYSAPDDGVRRYNAEKQPSPDSLASEQKFSELERTVIAAIARSDIAGFNHIMDGVECVVLREDLGFSTALASCILHVVLSCLDNGKQILLDAFSDKPQSYRSLYACRTRAELVEYLDTLCAAVVSTIDQRSSDPKFQLVADAKDYIRAHICDKLSLGEVASAIGISQNYLSSLFHQYSELGFSDYVMNLKIETAKSILSQEHLKVREVSDRLGFDNPHYFSKVFKKYTGYSPSESPCVQESSASAEDDAK